MGGIPGRSGLRLNIICVSINE